MGKRTIDSKSGWRARGAKEIIEGFVWLGNSAGSYGFSCIETAQPLEAIEYVEAVVGF
jgi:hypothetical protein